MNKDKDNAILVFHALTGDQFVSGTNPVTNKEGWWVTAVGPGKAVDTNKYFVICANVIGGCMGSLGPKDINPETKQPYGLEFPVITIKDMVRAQESLLDHLGIKNYYVQLEDLWAVCNFYNFARPFLIDVFQQFQLLVAQVIAHKILL